MTDLEKCDEFVSTVEGESPPTISTQRTLSGISPVHVRHNFIRKVFLILATQLALTAAIGLPFVLLPESTVLEFILSYLWLLPVSFAFACVWLAAANSSKTLLINFPWNYIVLFLFSVGQGVFFGMLSALLAPPVITLAIATLAVVILCLTIFAVQTRWDFSQSTTPYWLSFLITVGFFALTFVLIPGNRSFLAVRIISAMITLMFSFYFVFDTNRIVDGEKTDFHFDVDQYAAAALSLYVDIVRFIMLAARCFLPARDPADPHN